MIYISAGHNSQSKSIKQDPGAINKDGVKEGDLTIEFKHLVQERLIMAGVKYLSDNEEENLAMYLNRIKTGNGSVVVEYHFDASENPNSSGCTSIVGVDADRLDTAFARELAEVGARVMGIRNRGIINESDSHRGRLGLMRERGIVCLFEICFITNKSDLAAYHAQKFGLAKAHSEILIRYENLIS